MMEEILRRRFARANAPDASTSGSWAQLPDLIVLDGGKGQLNTALEVLAGYDLDSIPAVGLAKAREEVFVPGQSQPILLPLDSPGLQLLQRLRDEAHRFAISYHQGLRRRQGLSSVLEEIPGIGAKRRRALLRRFGSLEGIREASLDDLSSVDGMNRNLAARVRESL
jgi:excinuclease ABC subunit C